MESLPPNIAELADTGVELRNWLSHPATQAGFTVGIAAPMLENTLCVPNTHPTRSCDESVLVNDAAEDRSST
jgi:hypothetical protein